MPRRAWIPSNRQTVASLHANGCRLFGRCMECRRDVVVDMAALIARVGEATTVPDAARRIVCAGCRGRVPLQVQSTSLPISPFAPR